LILSGRIDQTADLPLCSQTAQGVGNTTHGR
jgi:hypothetical protein